MSLFSSTSKSEIKRYIKQWNHLPNCQTGQYICVALLQGKFNLYYLSFMEAASEKILCKELN